VLKYGLPVPAAKMTTRPFSRCRIARRLMYGSQTSDMVMALWTRVCWPWRSRLACSARPLMTVASIPMKSAVDRSMPRSLAASPRQMLPPPITTATCTPSETMRLTWRAM
jgi:hypothetical protein